MACGKPNTFLLTISIGIDNHIEIVCSDAVKPSCNSVRNRKFAEMEPSMHPFLLVEKSFQRVWWVYKLHLSIL